MHREKIFHVYIMANCYRTIYIGVTSDLVNRVYKHKKMLITGFTANYKLDRLVYYEQCPDANSAIAREKELKGWLRKKKLALIESMNPKWEDLPLS
jgi:putative endonuclease